MPAWRRRLLELFPDLRIEINQDDSSLYLLFSELVRRTQKAHDDQDSATLEKIYGFAAWCFEQRAADLWNPAGVSFYEHLFASCKDRTRWAEILEWVGPRIAHDVWGLWEWRLTAEELADLRRILGRLSEKT